MKKTYFAECRCSEDLKELYRKLALANHPDRGGDLETMKTINAEFDTAFDRLKNVHRSIKEGTEPYYTAQKSTTETAGEFREIIEALLERYFFHLTQNPEGLPFEEVSTIYENIKNALITWHQINKK